MIGHIPETLEESSSGGRPEARARFGRACALYQAMMPQLIETLEPAARRHCSPEEARELLEALRSAYQTLSFAERSLVKNMIGQEQRQQEMQEIYEERECSESVL